MEMQFTIDQLPQFAATFWKAVGAAKVFLFYGDMGAGKTTTITALCHYKGVEGSASSPTFSIINEYSYKEGNAIRRIYHIDLYRLKDVEEMIAAGVEECIYSGDICFIEWPQKAPELFDEGVIHVLIKPLDAQTRNIKILTHAQFLNQSMAEQL